MRIITQTLKLGLAALVVLAVSTPAEAVVVYAETALAAQRTFEALADLAAEQHQAGLERRSVDAIRNQAREARKQFIAAMSQLDQEIARLRADPKGNAALLAELQKAKKQGEAAREYLKKLTSLMADDKTMLGAKKSGFLGRSMRKVAATMGATATTIESAHTALAPAGEGNAGFIEVLELSVTQGEMVFYMKDYVAGRGVVDVPLRKGQRVEVRRFPIRIRAAIQDDNKKRLAKLEKKRVVGSSQIEFDNVTGYEKGHKFVYTGKPGTTTWIARESYVWQPSRYGPTSSRIRAFSQTRSDLSTEPKTGDIVEIHPKGASAQGLVLEVSAQCLRWDRRSILVGGERAGKVVPKNNKAKATLKLSYFSHNP